MGPQKIEVYGLINDVNFQRARYCAEVGTFQSLKGFEKVKLSVLLSSVLIIVMPIMPSLSSYQGIWLCENIYDMNK
jgi:hypothetical protein